MFVFERNILGKKTARHFRKALHGFVTILSSASIVLSTLPQVHAQQIIIDPSAPGTSFLQTSNGTPQVNIATPQSGVSVNQFKNFNVDQNGLVLNNSTSNGVSVIGQNVTANPNLMVSGPASTIVNEVTSTAPSSLTGTTEVFGQRAAVIIANPNGITCNGCAFLNSSSSTLTTGKPIVNGSRVDLHVTQGTVTIGPNGFTAGQQAGVFGRHVNVNGAITTDAQGVENSLVLSGGAQRVNNLDFERLSRSSIVAAPSTIAKTSPFAIDASEGGTLTGGQIVVRGAEAGQGANLYGTISGKSISAQSAGNLFYKDVSVGEEATFLGSDVRQYGDLSAGETITIGANQFTLYDGRTIETSGDITINASEFAVIAGEVSGNNVRVDVSTGSLTNTGFLMADGDLTILAGENVSQQRQIAREYDIYFDPALQQYLQAYYAQLIAGGQEADIAAEMIARAGQHEIIAEYIDRGATSTGTNVTITATTGDITNTGGAIAGTNDVRLTAGANIINQFLALRSRLDAEDGCSGEDCGYRTDFHAGEILAGNDLTLTAGLDIKNLASDMAAANDLTLNAGRDFINSLKESNYSVSQDVVKLTGGVTRRCYYYGGKDNNVCIWAYTVPTTETEFHFDEENILSPGRIVTLYGDVEINTARDFVVIGSQISAGDDLNVNAGGQAVLSSFVDAEEDYVRRIEQSTEHVCTYGKDGGCSWQNIRRTVTDDGTVLATATSNLIGRNVSITSEENITLLGARFLASGDLDLTSTNGSVLIDSTDLPDTVDRNYDGGAQFVELSDDLITQIFGPATADTSEEVAENTSNYVSFLKENDLLTAVEALRRAESGADIKEAARAVGVQSYVSLVDSSRLSTLRDEAQAAINAVHGTFGAQFAAHEAEVSQYHDSFRAELAELEGRLDLTDSERTAEINQELQSVTASYQADVAAAEAAYNQALAANQAQYGHLLTTQQLRSRRVGWGKGSYTQYYYVTVPNTHYINLKNTADANAQNNRAAALNTAESQRQLNSALVRASFSDAAINEQISELAAEFNSRINGFGDEKAQLTASLNTQIAEAMRRAELVVQQEAADDAMRRGAIAKGTVVEGEKSLASALTNEAFPELNLIQDVATNAQGIVENHRDGDEARTRLVTQTRDVGEFQESIKIVQQPRYTYTCTGSGKGQYCRNVTTYVNVEVPETNWVITGTEEYLAEETYFDGVASQNALFSEDKAEQDAFVAATAWRFATHGGLKDLEATPRSVVLAEGDLSVTAKDDIYVVGETALIAGNDLTANAGRRIGLLGAINTNFRLDMGIVDREIGHFEKQTKYVRTWRPCGKDCNGSYVDVPVLHDVWVVDGVEDYDLTYDGFKDIGETLQFGTLATAYNLGLAESAVLDHQGLLGVAQQTRNYDLVTTAISAGGDLSLSSGGDVLNFGGSLISGENLYINAETDVRNEALRENFTLTAARGCVALACGREGHEYKPAEILSGSGMVITAGQDIINNGAVISAAGSIVADAGRDINNTALTSQYLYHYVNSSSFFGLKRKKQLLHRAVISEGSISSEYGSITLNAGRDIISEGSMISAGEDLGLHAERDVRLTAISEEVHNYFKKRGFSGLAYGQDKVTWNEFSTAFAQVEGNNIAISAGRDVTGIGALIFAAQDIDIVAGEDVTFDAHQNLRYENRSGWSIGISFGGSGIIEALLNDGDVLEAYVNTNPALAAVHRLATGDFSAGALLNLGYHLPAFGSAVNQGANGPTSITQSLVEQLNPFSWMEDNALFNPSAFNGNATAKDFLSGITFRFSTYKSRREWTESYVSQIIAGQDLWLDAGKDIALVGGTIASANRDASLYAGENILVAALADSSRSSSSGWGVSVGFTPGGVTFGADYNRSRATARMYTNAALTAGETLDIVSGQTTSLMGANLAATDIYIDAGEDLIIQSRQNTSSSSSFGFNFSVTFTGGVPTGFSGGVNGSNANRRYTDTPTTIVAQDRLSIYTGRTTYLLGAGLWSETGNLELDTGDLLYDNYSDNDRSSSYGVNVSVGFTPEGVFDPSNSDLSGTFAYRNVDALTFATVGPGTIRVRDYVDYDFSQINRDPDNMQRVISETDFSIEIPGINLTRWTQQVRDTINLIEAATADVPDRIRTEGAQAVDQWRDLILKGSSPREASRLVATPEFRAALDLRNRYIKAVENPDGLGPNPSSLLTAIAKGEKAFWDASQGKYVIETNCGASFGRTPCQILVSSGELQSQYTAEDVAEFYTSAFNALATADTVRDADTLELARLALACLAQVAIETGNPAVIQNARAAIGVRQFNENMARVGIDPFRFDVTERLLIAAETGDVSQVQQIQAEISNRLDDVNTRYGSNASAGLGRLWAVANIIADELAAGRSVGPNSQILSTDGGMLNTYGAWVQAVYEKPYEETVLGTVALLPGIMVDQAVGDTISALGMADALLHGNLVPHEDGGVVAGYNANGELVYLYENSLTGETFWYNPQTNAGYENIVGDVLTLASFGTVSTIRVLRTGIHTQRGVYSGKLTKVDSPDPHADALAQRLGGESRVKFANDPNGREFDVVSSEYLGQAKPGSITVGSSFRNQAKATFEAAKESGRKVYYHFDSPPSQSVINRLNDYSIRYDVPVIIDTNPL